MTQWDSYIILTAINCSVISENAMLAENPNHTVRAIIWCWQERPTYIDTYKHDHMIFIAHEWVVFLLFDLLHPIYWEDKIFFSAKIFYCLSPIPFKCIAN